MHKRTIPHWDPPFWLGLCEGELGETEKKVLEMIE